MLMRVVLLLTAIPLIPPPVCVCHADEHHKQQAPDHATDESHDHDDHAPNQPTHEPFCLCAITLGDIPLTSVTGTVSVAELASESFFTTVVFVLQLPKHQPILSSSAGFQGNCALYIDHCALII